MPNSKQLYFNDATDKWRQYLLGLLPIALVFLVISVLGNRKIMVDYTAFLVLTGISTLLYSGVFFTGKKYITNPQSIYYAFIGFLAANLLMGLNSQWLGFLQPFRLFIITGLGLFGGISTWFVNQANAPPLLKTDNEPLLSNKIYKILLGLIVLGGFVIRMWNLDLLDSYRDEDHHLANARNWLQNGYFTYGRAKIVSYLATFFVWIGGAESYYDYVYWARVPSAIIGALAAIPMYLLGKRINPATGLVSASLWLSSPWIIGLSRNIRESIYYVAAVMVLSLVLLQILEWLIENPKKYRKNIIRNAIVIVLVLAYAFFVDWFSTLKVGGVVLAVLLGSYTISHFNRILPLILKYKWIVGIGAVVVVLGLIVPISGSRFLGSDKLLDIRWSNTFFDPTSQTPVHWWQHSTRDSFLVYGLLLIGCIGAVLHRSKAYFTYLLTFLILLTAYHFLFNRYYAPRYIAFAFPFFIISISAALVYLFKIFSHVPNDIARFSLYAILGLFFGNVFAIQQSFIAVTNPAILNNSAIAITGQFHNDKKELLNFFNNYITDTSSVQNTALNKSKLQSTPFISSIYENVLIHELGIDTVFKYYYKDSLRFKTADSIMNMHPNGWMVLDYHRNGFWKPGFPIEKDKVFKRGNSKIKMVSNEKQCHIYYWTTNLISKNIIQNTYVDSLLVNTEVTLDLNKPFTLSFWINNLDSICYTPFYIGHPNENGIYIEPNDRAGLRINYGSDVPGFYLETPQLNDGKWHHIAFYQYGGAKGSPMGMYIDGVAQKMATVPAHKSNNTPIQLSRLFNGKLSDIRIYETVLNNKKIATLTQIGAQTDTNEPITSNDDFMQIQPLAKEQYVQLTKDDELVNTIATQTDNNDVIATNNNLNDNNTTEEEVEKVDYFNNLAVDSELIAFLNTPVIENKKGKTPSKTAKEPSKTVTKETNNNTEPKASKTAKKPSKNVIPTKTTNNTHSISLYYVQIGAFKSVSAKNYSKASGIGGVYKEKSKGVNKILIGPYLNKSDANKAAAKLKTKGYKGFTRTITYKHSKAKMTWAELSEVKKNKTLGNLQKIK